MRQLSRQLAQRAQSVCIECLQRSSATMISLAVVLVWRTYALYGKSKKVLTGLVIMWTVRPGLSRAFFSEAISFAVLGIGQRVSRHQVHPIGAM